MDPAPLTAPSRLRRALKLGPLMQACRNRLWFRRELCYYSCAGTHVLDLPRPRVLRRNCFEDLRHYEAWDPWQLSPEAYRRESQKRLKRGHHLYTLVLDGRLAYYGWLADREPTREEPLFGQVFLPPSDAAMIYDCYTHPAARGRGLYYHALCQMLHDARELSHAEQICIGTLADNHASRRVIEKIAFRYIGSMVKKRRLLKLERYAIASDSRFRTVFLHAS